MNIIRFNDPFEAAIKVWPNEIECPFKDGWQQSPLFEYVTTREKEQSAINAFVGNADNKIETCPWPFETFRLSLLQTSKGWEENGVMVGKGRYRVDLIVTRKDEQVHFMGNAIELYDETPQAILLARRYNPLIMFMTDAHTSVDNPTSYYYHTGMFASGRWIPQNATLDTGRQLVMGMIDSVAGFIMDSMTPSNFIATVEPAALGRSVEWVKARTHYTLITHGHPANRPEVAHGERVKADAEEELKRMAHNRRAHYKTLRHQRYRFARGKTIFVKACWVGPKEWRDEGGRQIYKILEPVAEEVAA